MNMMTCQQAQQMIERQAIGDQYAPADTRALQAHVAQCRSCRLRQAWEQRITEELRRETVPAPSADFESRVLAAATGRDQGRRSGMPMLGAAIAASLMLALVTASLWLSEADQTPKWAASGGAPAQPVVATEGVTQAPAWSQEQTVRLAFTSRSQLDDVSLTLELPPNVELARFPGRHQLTWQVDLKPGDNVIALPLRIAYPQAGELVAHLDDGKKRKTFRTPIPGLESLDQEPML